MVSEEIGVTSFDGTRLFGRLWAPESEARGAVAIVHGLGEHSGRYEHVAAAFAAADVAVTTIDLRGHGQTEGKRGHIAAYETFLQDIDALLAETGRRYPGVPHILYGHSMGGNLVLNYALRRRPQLAGVVATSPWLRLPDPPSDAIANALAFVAQVWPNFSQGNKIDPAALSRDPAVGTAYLADPLVHNRISARLFTEVRRAGHWALEQNESFPLPVLLIHGGGDKVTSSRATREFGNSAPDATLKIWPQGMHELHNEPNKEEVLAFVVNWVVARIES